MVTDILEENVLKNTENEMRKAGNRDSVNKIYRQSRIWVRFHCHFAKGCSVEHSQELNNKLKHIRWNILKELEEK